MSYCSILGLIILQVLWNLVTITGSENQQHLENDKINSALLRMYDTRNTNSDLTIRLQDYPNYSMKLSLGATSEDPSTEQNVTITLIPPQDHGVLIIVKYPSNSYESQSKSLSQAFRYFTSEMQQIVESGETLCLDYLVILNSNSSDVSIPAIIQSCSYLSTSTVNQFLRKQSVQSYFKGVEYYANDANQEVTLLRIPAANPNEGHSLKPTLIITSYVDCSSFAQARRRNLYKECSPPSTSTSISNQARQQLQFQHLSDESPSFCVPSRLFCDGHPNCIHRDEQNGSSASVVVVGADETDCGRNRNAVTFSPLFPTRPSSTSTTTSVPSTTTRRRTYLELEDDDSDTTPTTVKPTITTKRPWWKPILPSWTPWGSKSEAETTTTTKAPTTTTPSIIRVTFTDDTVRTPWYSPSSPFGTVIIFAAVVILVFGICSFLAKLHSTRPVYASGNCDSPSSDRPFSAESSSFARQLIEMIEEEELRNASHSHDRASSPRSRTNSEFNPEEHQFRVEIRPPPPKYIDDPLPSYDSLFANTENDKNEETKPDNNR